MRNSPPHQPGCRPGGLSRRRLAAALALGAALAGCNSSSRDGGAVRPLAPQDSAQQALAEYDTNKDGALDAKEIAQSPGLKALAATMGRGANARLTADEIAEQFQVLQNGARTIGTNCVVLLDGKPLADASVRFVPEKFLGPGYKPATGKTNAGGSATMITEGLQDGVAAGLYRVEITKPDASGRETVPARYNTQTTLGCAVGIDNRSSSSDVTFRITSK